MRHSLALLTALVALGQPVLARDPHPDAAGFFEDFTGGGLDKDRWYVSDGWTNGDWQDCHWSGGAVQVRDGKLTLFHIPAPKDSDAPPPLRRGQNSCLPASRHLRGAHPHPPRPGHECRLLHLHRASLQESP